MKTLPLFYYPTTWLWIDDDRTTLRTMAEIFGDEGRVLPFQSGRVCLEFLSQYQSPLSQQSFLKSITDDEQFGILQRTPVDFDVTKLAALADASNRHEEITVMVIDYHMPEMDGFGLAKATHHLPIKKILLTGKAQEGEAVIGFNNTLIHRFVQKAEEKQSEKLSLYLNELSLQYFEKLTAPLLSNLEAEFPLPLSDPIFIEFFKSYCEQHEIKEYYLIDKQGSFLCLDAAGARSYLVVQSERGLNSWLALNGQESSLSNVDLKALQERKKIPFFGAGKEAWQTDSDDWSKHFYEAEILNGRERYFWTTIV